MSNKIRTEIEYYTSNRYLKCSWWYIASRLH